MQALDLKGARELIARRHEEWREHQLHWQRVQDSLEGGDRYRNAIYGVDARGEPVRNLIRHKKEYAPPRRDFEPDSLDEFASGRGKDPYQRAAEDAYNARLARTPIPTLFADVVRKLLARIYCREVMLEIPETGFDDLRDWIEDVDGRGTSLEEWLAEEVGELFLGLGQIDLQVERPSPPNGTEVADQGTVERLGLDRCHASVILPENLLWWRLGPDLQYAEALVREYHEDASGCPFVFYRHWDSEGSVLYSDQGEPVVNARGETVTPHPYGRVPIERVFDKRKVRCRNVGLSRIGGILDLEREYYNADSEVIIGNTLRAHPTLQGPQEAVTGSNEISVGPGWVLPKITGMGNATVGWDYVDPPMTGSEFVQTYKQDLLDRIDRIACLTKPAGASGSGGSTVSQSGLSKSFDARDGNDLLAKIARSLARLHTQAMRLGLVVIRNGKATPEMLESVSAKYPSSFNLLTAMELAESFAELQAILESAGRIPEVEKAACRAIVAEILRGQSDDQIEAQNREIEAYIDERAEQRDQEAEAGPLLAIAQRSAMGQLPGPRQAAGGPAPNPTAAEPVED